MILNAYDRNDHDYIPPSILDFFLKNRIGTTQNSRILIQSGHNHFYVNIDEIIYATAEGHFTNFILSKGSAILASEGIKFYADTLIKRGFFKAHRSCILNISHISSIYKKETIVLSNNDKINIPVRNKVALTELVESLK